MFYDLSDLKQIIASIEFLIEVIFLLLKHTLL